MHFIGEALYRRPLEPKPLAYSRGGTAISMGILFLAFCGYLISQIYYDIPLIQISSEQILTDTETPDVEICAQRSTLRVVACTAMYYNWTSVDLPNCHDNYIIAGKSDDITKCYYFAVHNKYRMATGLTSDNRDAIRRIDFYWHLDSQFNVTHATISLPAIAVQLYHPKFTTWRPDVISNITVEKEMMANIQLGATRSTSYLNHTSNIFFTPQKYRAVKSSDAGAILGLKPDFINIMTIVNYQHNWPLQSNPPSPPAAVTKDLYDGVFSIQLAQSTIDVKTEIRQHTVLAAVALAGGCYGIFTTFYILMFGMTRLTPWGLVHHVPEFINRKKRDKKDVETTSRFNPSTDEIVAEKSMVAKKNFSLIPWFISDKSIKNSAFTSHDRNRSFMRKIIAKRTKTAKDNANQIPTETQSRIESQAPKEDLLDTVDSKRLSSGSDDGGSGISIIEEKQYVSIGSPLPQPYEPSSTAMSLPSLPLHYTTPSDDRTTDILNTLSAILAREQARSDHIEELEIMLSEYFINTGYLDQLRSRKKTKLTSTSDKDDD